MLSRQAQGGLAIAALNHLPTARPKEVRQGEPEIRIVIDDQYCLHEREGSVVLPFNRQSPADQVRR
jgi:hypothetical protein